jgi:hypothetical protein
MMWLSISGSSLPLMFCIHVRSGSIYWGGVFTLQKRLKCDGNLHVNMFHYLKIPYFIGTFFLQNIPTKNILDLIFYRTLFYDFRQWTPRAFDSTCLFSKISQVFYVCNLWLWRVIICIFLLLFTTYIFCMGVIAQTFVIFPNNICRFMVIGQLKKSTGGSHPLMFCNHVR